jgi:uncharacterized protein
MNSTTTLLSVRADARQVTPPDSAVLSCAIRAPRDSKADALRVAASALDEIVADLAALGAVALTAETGRRPITWSAQSATTFPERERMDHSGKELETGRVIAHIVLLIGVRALAQLDALSAVLATHEQLNVQSVGWYVDDDNPAWPQVRAAAIHAAITKGRDYAAALGGTLSGVEHIADTGLLGGSDTGGRMRFTSARSVSMAASAGMGGEPEAPSLDPVPQELAATIEARFTATIGSPLPGSGVK